MCWKSEEKPVLKVAEEDIPVFKIVLNYEGDKLISLYYEFNYDLNVEYSCENELVVKLKEQLFLQPYSFVNEGFHSFSNNCRIDIFQYDYGYFRYIIRGEYNFVLEEMTLTDKIKKANCIIPKGSKYYLNEKGEYVSDKIKIISVENVLV